MNDEVIWGVDGRSGGGVATTERRPRGASGSAGHPAADAEPLSLDIESCNSTDDDKDGIYPVWSGGRFDPEGGKAKRFKDFTDVKELCRRLETPLFLTLTLDRDKWTRELTVERWQALSQGDKDKLNLTAQEVRTLPVEELAYRMQALKFCRLMRRLGFKVWCRVIEPQCNSGDGWMHWHAIVEARGSGWCEQRPQGPWVHLKGEDGLPATLKRIWSAEFGGGIVHVDLVRSREKIGSYLAKYVCKAWPAVPRWMLVSSRGVRVFALSKAAGELLGRTGQRRGEETGQRREKRRPLIDRLAESGARCNLIKDGRYLATIDAPWWALAAVTDEVPELEWTPRGFEYERRERDGSITLVTGWKGVLQWRGTWVEDLARGSYNRLMTLLEDRGLLVKAAEWVDQRRHGWMESWELMQAELLTPDSNGRR